MVTVATNSTRTSGITAVRAVVTSTHVTPQTVRLRCCLEAPVWVARRDGIVDPRWNDDKREWELTIRPDRCRGIGFASPNPPTEPLVEVVSSDRCDPADLDDPADPDTSSHSSAAILADLDHWSPTSHVLEREREHEHEREP